MAKRTKFSKFRSLYDVIESLLDTYTHEGVVEILAESHDLELSVSTLRSYLYRYKKQSKELSVATDNFSGQDKINLRQQKTEKVAEDQNPIEPKMTADEALARFKERQQNKSLFDRKATDTVSIERTEIESSEGSNSDTDEDLDAALEEMKIKLANKSILNKE
ncbi:hypothetical protein [Psychrobacter submarinus]|uniref:hypothetical protein n=1 Tax=Psychrobacter submarinus TaxID=154108 RepID=UPI00191A45EE|nr:hypothetical protein [Psychrobacter submarinus]